VCFVAVAPLSMQQQCGDNKVYATAPWPNKKKYKGVAIAKDKYRWPGMHSVGVSTEDKSADLGHEIVQPNDGLSMHCKKRVRNKI